MQPLKVELFLYNSVVPGDTSELSIGMRRGFTNVLSSGVSQRRQTEFGIVLKETGKTALHDIQKNLAVLFKCAQEQIELEPIATGLSHKGYSCRVRGQRYFVKVYSPFANVAAAVQQINYLTKYMCDRGVPASRVCFYSPEFANMVVHEFVEGEMHDGKSSQIGAIAKLYSSVALLGVEHARKLSKQEYLDGIAVVLNQMKSLTGSDVIVDASVHEGMQALAETVQDSLLDSLPGEGLLHIPVHDDFTEKNILMQGEEVKLLCDWDSYRLKMFNEHLACTATRFSTSRPLQGEVDKGKLQVFLNSLSPRLIGLTEGIDLFAERFPYLACLKHLRTYTFRNSVVSQNRPELKTYLLDWPLHHCRQLINNKLQLADWVHGALISYSEK